MQTNTVGQIIFEEIKFCTVDSQNFSLNKNFHGKSFEVIDKLQNFYCT